MRIAVLGMGKMGHAVAGRLLDAGHDVTVWNRSPGKADDLVERGAEEAESAAAATRRAEVTMTSLADDAAVLAVVTGEGGIAEELAQEGVLVDLSTVAPETAEALREATGGRSLASPILGAPRAVESGRASYLVSGPGELFERLQPVYESLSSQVSYLGEEVGRALQMKLLANYLLLSAVAVLGEVVSAAEAVGISDEVLEGFLASSPLVPESVRNRLEALFRRDHAGWFTTALGAKDARLATEMAKKAGVVLPVAEVVKSRYEEAAATSYGDSDLTAVVELTRKK